MNTNPYSILITPDQYTLLDALPEDMRPSRASASVNFLVPINLNDRSDPALLLHNFDPKTYNTWYPPFHFVPWSLSDRPQTYRDLVDVAFEQCPEEARPERHSSEAAANVRRVFELSNFDYKADPQFQDEIWLKYSKSKQEWTVYRFNYYCAVDIDKAQLVRNRQRFNIDFLPLEGPEYKAACKTEKYNDIPVVDNLIRLLASPDCISVLKKAAI